MRKLIFGMIALLGVACMTVQAQSKTDTTKAKARTQLVKVATADVPAAITASLKGPDFSGWTVGDVYSNPEKTRFMVRASKGAEKKKLWFDQDGKEIKSKSSM